MPPSAKPNPTMRRNLIAVVSILALLAIGITGLAPLWKALLALVVVFGAGVSLRKAPVGLMIRIPGQGLLEVRSAADAESWQGRFDPLYANALFCAFRIRDPGRGRRVFGCFRDELPPETWRRVQVALRTG